MKVKCINIYNENIDRFEVENPWLTIGKIYIVLEVFISVKKGIRYRIIGDNANKSPGLYAASQFEIVSDKIPSNWQIVLVNKSLIVLTPVAWKEEDFWDKCYDHDPEALEIYKREARIIYAEENEEEFKNPDQV